MKILKKIYSFLTSAKLAMALLVAIFVCCVAGVTIWRGAEAGRMIFGTLWFNGILVLLVVNVACCFFGRIWGRRVTLISFGMILFHLSFVVIMFAVIYNSLFYFRGIIRLTEGETLPSAELQNYDYAEHGRFFSMSKMRGETTLIRMYAGYMVDGTDKRAAYEIAVGEEGAKSQGIIYITKGLKHKGIRYFNDKEGYSILIVLYDSQGNEIYGAYVPLQSLRQEDNTYLYTTGTKESPGSLPFPQWDEHPIFHLQVAYFPDPANERAGGVTFQVWPFEPSDKMEDVTPLAEGGVPVGERFDTGEYYLSVKEVRYWVGMTVRYDPGLPIVLTSLWVSLGGMAITFIGRLRKSRN
jgi:hypothetical protein